jgi:hypothetical protein
MARKLNRCYWNATSSGTSDFIIGTAIDGFLTPNQAIPSIAGGFEKYYYVAENGNSEWELGLGRVFWDGPDQKLSREYVLYSTNPVGDDLFWNKVNFTTNPKVRLGVPLAEDYTTSTPVRIVTGASPVEIPDAPLVYIQTGGTGGAEQITLNSNLNDTTFGRRTIIFLEQRTASGDHVTCSDADISFDLVSTNDWVELSWDVWNFQWILENATGVGSGLTNQVKLRDATGASYWTSVTSQFGGVSINPYYTLRSSGSGNLQFSPLDPNDIYGIENRTTGASTLFLNQNFYQQTFTSGGTGGDENVALIQGSYPGQRMWLRFLTRTNASDKINFISTIVNSSGVAYSTTKLNAVGDGALLEWDGSNWRVIYLIGSPTFT